METGRDVRSGKARTAAGVLCFIGVVGIGFSIGTAFGILAIVLSWVVARILEGGDEGGKL